MKPTKEKLDFKNHVVTYEKGTKIKKLKIVKNRFLAVFLAPPFFLNSKTDFHLIISDSRRIV